MPIDSFYKSKRWIKKKNAILRRYQYECQESKRYGIRVKAEMVHHIYPRKEYPELAIAVWYRNVLRVVMGKDKFVDSESNGV